DIYSFGVILAELMSEYNFQALVIKALAERGPGAEITHEDVVAMMPDIFKNGERPLPASLDLKDDRIEHIKYQSEKLQVQCWNKLLKIVAVCTEGDPLKRAKNLN